eukprot:SAG31_NODE_20036_length_585_cov_1.115226_2_plen_49_part_01
MSFAQIFTKDQARNTPLIDISQPPKEDFELRICVYKTRDVAIMDELTQM